jgi:large subunit ribosomal protein L28
MYGKIGGLEDGNLILIIPARPSGLQYIFRGNYQVVHTNEGHIMAKCEACGKTTQFGQNRPWSKKSTKRTFKPNLQKVTVFEDGKKVSKVLCTRCIRSLTKV